MGIVDIIATMNAEEYCTVRARLQSEGMWNEPALADEANELAEQLIREMRK